VEPAPGEPMRDGGVPQYEGLHLSEAAPGEQPRRSDEDAQAAATAMAAAGGLGRVYMLPVIPSPAPPFTPPPQPSSDQER